MKWHITAFRWLVALGLFGASGYAFVDRAPPGLQAFVAQGRDLAGHLRALPVAAEVALPPSMQVALGRKPGPPPRHDPG